MAKNWPQSSIRYSEKVTPKPKRDPGGAYAKQHPSMPNVGMKQGNVKRTSLPKGGRISRSR